MRKGFSRCVIKGTSHPKCFVCVPCLNSKFKGYIKKLDASRKRQFKAHQRDGKIILEKSDGEWKAWQWCFTHKRHELAGWL